MTWRSTLALAACLAIGGEGRAAADDRIPQPLPLAVAEGGAVAFVSSVVPMGDGGPAAPLPMALYAFGETLYAEVALPLTNAEYEQRYGFDAYEIVMRFAHPSVSCRAWLGALPGKTLSIALLRDARISADVDLTPCVLEQLPLYGPKTTWWSPAIVEVRGYSHTPGVRPRSVAHDAIDFGIDPRSLPEQLEKYALTDRHLRKEVALEGLPASQMPSVDDAARAAVDSAKHPLRAVITSETWQVARDLKTRDAHARFVVGLAALRRPDGTCAIESEVWTKRANAPLVARPSGAPTRIVPCASLGRS
jgi:hypothetical protein